MGGAPSTSRRPGPSRASVSKVSSTFLTANCAVCNVCNGYYGPAFSQPVCATCHAFLYANDLDQEINLQIMSAEEMDPDEDRELMGPEAGEDSDRDSGNEEEAVEYPNAAAAAPAAPAAADVVVEEQAAPADVEAVLGAPVGGEVGGAVAVPDVDVMVDHEQMEREIVQGEGEHLVWVNHAVENVAFKARLTPPPAEKVQS